MPDIRIWSHAGAEIKIWREKGEGGRVGEGNIKEKEANSVAKRLKDSLIGYAAYDSGSPVTKLDSVSEIYHSIFDVRINDKRLHI